MIVKKDSKIESTVFGRMASVTGLNLKSAAVVSAGIILAMPPVRKLKKHLFLLSRRPMQKAQPMKMENRKT